MINALKKYKAYHLSPKVLAFLSKYKYTFNPSLVIHDEVNYLAIRVYDNVSKSILALLLIWQDDKEEIVTINLTDYFKEKLNFSKVADPKLFLMEGQVYGSFNTSHATDKPNELALFQLNGSKIENYYLCNYNERMRTEKNWAFFYKNQTLFALYSLEPLTVLKAETIDKDQIVFKKYFEDKTQNYKDHSIGTPLIELENGYGFMAHKKYYRKRKRLYLGKPCLFNFENGFKLKVKRQFYFHSYKSLLGEKFKFNKNLISCTYFSGICRKKDKLILGYGINDIDWNIVVLNKNKLWH